MIERGHIYWTDLGTPEGSRPAKRRPVLVISADQYNDSRIATTIVAVITSNTGLSTMPGNVFLPAIATGLPKDSVVNVTAIITVNKSDLESYVGSISTAQLQQVEHGLRLSLGL